MKTLQTVIIEQGDGSNLERFCWTYGDDPEQLKFFVDYLLKCLDARQLTVALASQKALPDADFKRETPTTPP